MRWEFCFFFRPLYSFETGEIVKRADRFVYDRYITGAYGILILITIYYLVCKKEVIGKWAKTAIVMIEVLCIGMFHFGLVHQLNNVEFSLRNTIASGMFVHILRKGNDANAFPGISTGLQKGAVVALAFLLIVFLISEMRKRFDRLAVYAVLLVTIVSFGTLTHFNWKKLRVGCDENVRDKVEVSMEFISAFPKEISEKYEYVVVENQAKRRKPYQIGLKQFKVLANGNYPPEEEKDMIFVARSSNIEVSNNLGDCFYFSDFDNNSFYLPYIKGEELKSALEGYGYKLEKLPVGTSSLKKEE